MNKKNDNTRSLYKDIIEGNYDVRSGALAVVNPNIKMVLNEYGEYEARADDIREFDDPKLVQVSAMTSEDNEDTISERLFGGIEGIKYAPVIGYYSGLYAGYVNEGEYRAKASSGGMATWLLKEMFERKLIDGVIHVRRPEGTSDVLFEYGVSRSIEEMARHSKSHYYPAEFSRAINEVKSKGGVYAIVGIPSLIMEFRLLAQVDQEVRDRIKYTIGLICGHQKSTKYAESMAWQFGIKPGDLKHIDFRKKIDGSPSSKYATEFRGLVDGEDTVITKMQDEIFVTNWGHGMFKTKMSDYTDDTFNETADISLGDAWLPEYTSDSGGNNVAIVRNDTIQEIINEGVEDGKLKLDTLTEDRIIASQSGLVHHTRDELPYRLHKLHNEGVWGPRKRVGIDISGVPKLKRAVQDIREQISSNSHLLYREAVEKEDWAFFEDSMQKYTDRYSAVYRKINMRRALRKGPIWTLKKLLAKLS